MVVSEMGEQWSPQTAPAMQAEMEMMDSGSADWREDAPATMGIRMPKVPQEVPVAKDKPQAMMKMIAGRNAHEAASGSF